MLIQAFPPDPVVPHAGINRISDLNEDILHLIFEHFELQPGSQTIAQTRKDLLSAAKTCKAFVEPALNSLWRVLPSLLPLLLLLPSAEVRNNHYVSPRPSLYLSRHSTYFIKFVDRLPLKNWERFDIHAPRVRSLYLEPLHMIISPHVYLRICSLRHRDTPLLPGLKEIYTPDESLNTSLDFSSAMLLVSDSSLDSIHLGNSATSDHQFCIPFLFLLSVNSPNLTQLTLYGIVDISSSLELVTRFRDLQSLDLRLSGTYLSSQFLQDLGNLDNLLDLTLDTTGSSSPTEFPTTRPPTNSTFIQLRKLHILGTPSSISRVLDDMRALMNLTTLLIHEKTDDLDLGRHTESSWKRCFGIISTFPAIENIQVTQLEYSPRRNHCLSTSCFYPLYQLNNVTSFMIQNATLSGSDEDFRFLACAFPKMKKFVEPCAEYTEGKTLACLFHFSQANRHLRELKISLAALDISDNFKAINAIGRPIVQDQHPLESLHITSNFGSLNVPDMIHVAQFLDLIFPNLSILKAYGSNTREASTWTQIQQIRVALQAARIKASSATRISNEQGENGILP